jgi:hypothetical protein
MILERIAIRDLVPNPMNPRLDLQPMDPEYQEIKRSIERWGNVQPLVWNRRSGHLVGGHQRLKVLLEAGETEADVAVVDLGPADEMALSVALNKVTGRWDDRVLFDVLSGLQQDAADTQLLTLTGFKPSDLSELADRLGQDEVLFQPLMPNASPAPREIEDVTAQEVKRAEHVQATRFGASKVHDVTCPHCGLPFGLSDALVRKDRADAEAEDEA